MKTKENFNIISLIMLLIFTSIFVACNPFSKSNLLSDSTSEKIIGINGGFEEVKDNLPLNWLIYSPKTIPKADFKITLDQKVYKEGMQSLRFDVLQANDGANGKYPGFTNEFFEVGKFSGEASYKLSFWLKNTESKFVIKAGSVSEKSGVMSVLKLGNETISDWTYYEYDIYIPEGQWLRIQLNILEAGTFWIDDVQIHHIN